MALAAASPSMMPEGRRQARRSLARLSPPTNIHHLILLVIVVFMLMYCGLGYIRIVLT